MPSNPTTAWAVATCALVALEAGLIVFGNPGVPLSRSLPLALSLPPLVVGAGAWAVQIVARWLTRRETPRNHFSAGAAVGVGLLVGSRLAVAFAALGASWQPGPWRLVGLAVGVALAAIGTWTISAMARAAPPSIRIGVVVAASVFPAVGLAGTLAVFASEGRGVAHSHVGRLWGSLERGALDPFQQAGVRSGPSVLLVTIDTWRADDASDEHLMPQLHAIGARGTRYSAAYSSAPWTLPSLATIHTGLSARRHGAGWPTGPTPLERTPLSDTVPTLAERLGAMGLRTGAVVTNPYASPRYGLDRGFLLFENLTMEAELRRTLAPTLLLGAAMRLPQAALLGDRGDSVVRGAARFLESVPANERFFLWLHFLDLHAPYAMADASFRDEILAGARSGARTADDRDVPSMAHLRAGEFRPDPESRRVIRAAYVDGVQAVDSFLGTLWALLESSHRAGDTLTVITADHGEEFWEHGGVEHGHTVYGELVHVPLIVVGPGVSASRIESRPVSLESLAPWLVEAVSPSRVGETVGTGSPQLAGLPPGSAPIISENLLFAMERTSARADDLTYIRWENGKEELYDRRRDPDERRDLAGGDARLGDARRVLDVWEARNGPAPVSRGHPSLLPRSLDPHRPDREIEALRALGYL